MTRIMKDTNIEWIGTIPEDWEVRKLSSIAETITDFVASGSFASLNENVEYLDEPDFARLIRTVDLTGKSSVKPVYINQHAYQYLSNSNLFGGELILSNIGSVGNVYMYVPMYERASLAPNAIMIRMKENNRFYYYWFLNPLVNEALKLIGSNNVQCKFNKTQLRKFLVVHPSVEEQIKISGILDILIQEIDNIIIKTLDTIENYKKYKQTIITEAVTKGIFPDIKLIDKGIIHIEKAPEHWEVSKLRFLGTLQNGISKSSEYFGSGYPFVNYGDVYRNYALPANVSGLAESSESDRKVYSVKEGDVLFTRTSETIEEVGFASTCLKTIENSIFSGFVIRFRPNTDRLHANFSKYYFRSEVHRKFFVKEMNLVTRASLSQELLKKLPVLIPPMKEQIEISEYLDGKCSEIDKLITKKEHIIQELGLYKKALIYEYVTGKKEI